MIRSAAASDKNEILGFCRILYPEGDYFEDTYDSWLAERELYVVLEGDKIVWVGCISVASGQGWIEGVRVRPDFGGLGYATRMKRHSEQLVLNKGGTVLRSLVEINNIPSLNLSRKCGYEIGDIWTHYEMNGSSGAPYRERPTDMVLTGMQYFDSWRLYDLNDSVPVTSLDDGTSFTVIPSKHFPGTTLVTILRATDLSGFLSYADENIIPEAMVADGSGPETGSMHGWDAGIHIASRLDASLFEHGFKKIESYHTTQKSLCRQDDC